MVNDNGSYWHPSLGHLFEDGAAQEMRDTFERVLNEHAAEHPTQHEPFDWEEDDDDEDDDEGGVFIHLVDSALMELMDAWESVEEEQSADGLMFIGQFLDDLLRLIVTAYNEGEATI